MVEETWVVGVVKGGSEKGPVQEIWEQENESEGRWMERGHGSVTVQERREQLREEGPGMGMRLWNILPVVGRGGWQRLTVLGLKSCGMFHRKWW